MAFLFRLFKRCDVEIYRLRAEENVQFWMRFGKWKGFLSWNIYDYF
jgi:hypothetical protein